MKQIFVIFIAAMLSLCSSGSAYAQIAGGNVESIETLMSQKQALTDQVEALINELATAKKSKQKKLHKQLVATQQKAESLERLIATFPTNTTDPQTTTDDREALKKQMAERLDQKMQGVDTTNVTLDDITDPEMRKVYENYQKYGDVSKEAKVDDDELTYCVQIGSGKRGKASLYRNAKQVQEIPISNGRAIYYSGSYTSKEQAKDACASLRRYYRDAFVISVAAGKKIGSH